LRLCGIQAPIYEVFVITRLNEIFEISKTVEDAIKTFN
jgi:anti-anti-sigma regulatory factor